MIFLQEQLSFLHLLQAWRGPFLNRFFEFLNFFDSNSFAILLIICVWFGYSSLWGRRLTFLLIGDALVNFGAKMYLTLPRPIVYDVELPLVATSTSFGCPSGGAQMAFILSCVFAYYWKTTGAWLFAISYGLLIGFSRLFLGVHFPIDVLGGWILGFGVFYFFIKTVHFFEHFCSKYSEIALILLLIFTAGFWTFSFQPIAIKYMNIASIVAISVYCKSKISSRMTIQKV